MKPYFRDDLTNEQYHNPDLGVSSSVLKSVLDDPAAVYWGRRCPRDETKMKSINFGTDFHSYFLEPDEFKKQYMVMPKFDRRKKGEKEKEQHIIAEWREKNITAITHEDQVKLESMRTSATCHPDVKEIMALDWKAERSYFWEDKITGLTCKCRTDLVADVTDATRPSFMPKEYDTLIADVKTTDNIDRIQESIERFKYWVQEPFYTEGVSLVTGRSVYFVFIFVSTTMSIGRYPVKLVNLSEPARLDGTNKVREALGIYSERQNTNNWSSVITIDRPYWATRDEEFA